jgi:hypothetical protein
MTCSGAEVSLAHGRSSNPLQPHGPGGSGLVFFENRSPVRAAGQPARSLKTEWRCPNIHPAQNGNEIPEKMRLSLYSGILYRTFLTLGGGGYMWRLRARTALLQKPKSKAGGEGAHSTYIYDQKTKHATVVESHPNVAKGAPLGWGTPQPILLRADS